MDKEVAEAEKYTSKTRERLLGHCSQKLVITCLKYSLAALLNHVALANRPFITEQYLNRYQRTFDRVLSKATGLDIIRFWSEGDANDSLTGIRLQLRTSMGGLGLRTFASLARAAYVNGFLMVIPRMQAEAQGGSTVERRLPRWRYPWML